MEHTQHGTNIENVLLATVAVVLKIFGEHTAIEWLQVAAYAGSALAGFATFFKIAIEYYNGTKRRNRNK